MIRLKLPRSVFIRHPFAIVLFDVFNKVRPYTCVNYDFLLQMKEIIKSLDVNKIDGAIVEAGCWKGGCGSFMQLFAKNRQVYLYDSFEKFPPLKKEDGTYVNKLNIEVAKESDVREISNKLGVNPIVIKGFFKDVPNFVGPIALLRLDSDLYDSTMDALDKFYDHVVKGGFIVIDDFDFPGCRMAVYDFFSKNKINAIISPMNKFNNAFFIKE